ncbi:hypothetical protein RDI58_016493 [Solanum bulbocastanum]|uniref:Uncharacterized protein n=1 Tax=Solanum bulbocastanum TaxID=147425 RepID=A0AAN8TG87_SOLBU
MTVIVENQAEVGECGCFLNAWLWFEQLVKKLMFKIEQEIRTKIQEPCMKVSTECGHVLKELALAMKTMTYPLTITVHIDNAKIAAENLKSLFHTNSSWEGIIFSDIIPMVESFDQLATLKRIKKTNRFAPVRIKTSSWKTKRVTPDLPNTESVHH